MTTKAPLKPKFATLASIAGASTIYGLEANPLTRRVAAQASVAYTSVATGLIPDKFDESKQTLGEFIVGRRRKAKALAQDDASGDIVRQIALKYFRYAGHVARSRPAGLPARLAAYRDARWRRENALKHHRSTTKILHRRGGTQEPEYDKLLAEYFASAVGDNRWRQIASDRKRWKEHEKPFAHYVRLQFRV